MKKVFGILFFIVAFAFLGYLGLQESRQTSEGLFRSGLASKAARTARGGNNGSPLARNFIGEMASKMIPEPDRTPRYRIGFTDEDLAVRDTLISSVSNLDLAKDYLLKTKPAWEFQKAYERYKVLELLVTAIAVKTNPSLDHALNTVAEIIQDDTFDQWDDRMIVTVAMGDRGYLYQALLHYRPEQAHLVYEKARGSRVNPLLDVAHNTYLAAKKKAGI